MTTSTSKEDAIRAEARALGFDVCRFTDIDEAWPAAAWLGRRPRSRPDHSARAGQAATSS